MSLKYYTPTVFWTHVFTYLLALPRQTCLTWWGCLSVKEYLRSSPHWLFFLALHLVKHWFLLSHPKACSLILPLPTFLLSLHASVCCLYSSNYLFNCLPFSSILESSRIKPTILQDSAVPIFLSNRWGSKQSHSLLSPNLWASSNLHCWIYLQHASVCMPASTVSWISIESFFILWNCQLVLHIKVLPMCNKYSSEINQSLARMRQNIGHIRFW